MADNEATPEFQMAVSDEGGETVLSVVGDLDLSSSTRFRERLIGLVAEGKHNLVVDLAGVGFMDSSGLGTLVSGLKRARQAGGDVVLRAPTPAVLRLIELTGLTRVLSIRD
jgi:anti-anti-sigma factor